DRLRKTVRLAVRFLDDVIDVNKYPMPQIEAITKANRRIGLGVMGFADMLIMLGIPYDSERALKAAGKLMRFITEESHNMSEELARKRGAFKNMGKSSWKRPMRNATTTTIAPTGSVSIIAGVSSGIEPLFAVSYVRKVLGGKRMVETNRLFKRIARERGFYSRKLMSEVARKGTVKGVKAVPKDIQRLFVTALEIKPGWHVRMQAAFQKHTDNAVSKTVNFPKSAKVADVEKVFLMAHKLKCKGITAYRYGSKEEQVMCIGCE
ncbi:MAG: ribonucleotide-diphosphate reductase subunit alpha, partial [Candidatus Aenigmarchaeota archaeon]